MIFALAIAAVPSFVASIVEWVEAFTIFHEQVSQSFHIVVGILLLLFGMRWLRKAILRFAGIVALHDEELIYQREVADLRAQGLSLSRWDNIGFWFSYKAILLEGLEVAFIV